MNETSVIRRLLLPAGIAATLALAACGGGSSGNEP